MAFTRGGCSGDQDVARKFRALRGECYEVGSFADVGRRKHQLLSLGMPSCLASQVQPSITKTVVTPHTWRLGTGIDMLTVRAQLVMTSSARSDRRVVAALAWCKDRKSHLGSQGQAERCTWQVGRFSRVPAELALEHPPISDLTIRSRRETRRYKPWANILHLDRKTLIEEVSELPGLPMGLKMSYQGPEVHPGMVIEVLQGFGHVAVQVVTIIIRGPFSN